MNHVFGYGVRLGAGLTVGAFVGLTIVGAAGYVAIKLMPDKDKKEEKEEESKDVTDNTESANF